MEDVQACNLCGSKSTEFVLEAEDHASGEKFSLVRCHQCGCVYTNPRPTSAELSRYYPPAYYGPNGQRFRGGLERVVHFFRQRVANQICQQFPQPGQILEVGSGRGTLLAELAQRGWQAVGTEYSTSLAEASFNNLGVKVFPTPNLSDCNFEAGAFQVVVCYHVLEHLPNPLETLTEIRRILQPQGLMIVVVPNFGGWVARLTGNKWFALDVPRHLFHFTPKTLTLALNQSGYSLNKQSTLSLEQDIFGFAQSCLNRAGLPFNILYDLIRSQQARLRHHASSTGVGGRLGNLLILALGGVLSLIGLPVTLLAALAGQGGTLEYWARPHLKELHG
jgi:SAM-dependent methyltransferase